MNAFFRFMIVLGLCGALLAGSAPVLAQPAGSSFLSSQEDVFIDQLTSRTWAYLHSDWATDNHLPWSWRSASLSGGDYANPTEIGFYALSWVAAYELQRSWSPTWSQTEAEVTAVLNQLRVWQTDPIYGKNAYNNSVFFQWYWINNSPPRVGDNVGDNHLVPAVDNAWLAASLITIREYAEAHAHPVLAKKANSILRDMDFTLWYHPDTHRFSWGDVENPQGGPQADYYSNENRIINFVARAMDQISESEFQLSLNALEKASGMYAGIVVENQAWDGSYFTYAGPALFIREMDTLYGWKTILPATRSQIKYSEDQAYTVWGLSDSYDVESGGYIQQGAPPVPMSDLVETKPGLVTPHASALALITQKSPQAIANLQYISYAFDCDDVVYGFLDSVMAKTGADFGKCSHRFSALDQEWIFLAFANYQTGFIWKYFYQSEGVTIAHAEIYNPSWKIVWNDEFTQNGGPQFSKWICDAGTSYPGGPPNWGTGEIQTYSCGTENLFQSGGYLNIRALHIGDNPLTNWTSSRIETTKTDFQPPPDGVMAVEARIRLPEVSPSNGQGAWPAFWMLGAPYRGNYMNWPGIGEIDIMENINGVNQWWGAFHCGINPGGPCNETGGISATVSDIIPGIHDAFHIYRVEWDRSITPEEIRWYVDGVQHHVVNEDQVGESVWQDATNHGFFILLNLAIGGGWAGNPTADTGVDQTMLVDYVRVYVLGAPVVESITRTSENPVSSASIIFSVLFSEPVFDVDISDFSLATSGVTGASVITVNGTGTTRTVTVKTGNGDGTIRLNVSGNAAIIDSSGLSLYNLPFSDGQIYNTKKSLILNSISSHDGWILERGENLTTGGSINVSSLAFRLGDDTAKRQYRSIISFNTGNLPDNAVITSMILKIKQQSVSGGTSPAMFNGFLVDIRKGIFGSSPNLQLTDFQASASKTIGPLLISASGGWYTFNLTAYRSYINKLAVNYGLTQFRLRFNLEDNNNSVANYIGIYSGDSPFYKPTLTIKYYTP